MIFLVKAESAKMPVDQRAELIAVIGEHWRMKLLGTGDVISIKASDTCGVEVSDGVLISYKYTGMGLRLVAPNPAVVSRGESTKAAGFSWKKYDDEHVEAGGVKVSKETANFFKQSEAAAKMRRYAPSPSQYAEIGKRLGVKITLIADEMQIESPIDMNKFNDEVNQVIRQNIEAAGAEKDVTERPDRFEPR
jgi:hypothetical protein